MIPSNAVTTILAGNTAGNAVAAVPGGALNTAVAVLPATGPIGAVAATVLSIFGPLIKGATGHLSYDAVLPVANRFQSDLIPVFVGAYGPWNDWSPAVARNAAQLFGAAMQSNWGLATTLNQQIFTIVTNPDARLIDQLGYFVIWVGTNVDQASADSFSVYFNTLFSFIFVTALQQSGLDPTKVTLPPVVVATDVKAAGGSGATGAGTGNQAATTAGFSSGTLAIVAIAAIAGAMLIGKGK